MANTCYFDKKCDFQHLIGIINIKPHFVTSQNIYMRKQDDLRKLNIIPTYNFQNIIYWPIFVAKVANFWKQLFIQDNVQSKSMFNLMPQINGVCRVISTSRVLFGITVIIVYLSMAFQKMWLIPDILTKNAVYRHFIGIINIKPHFLTSRNIYMRKQDNLWKLNITVTFFF